ncbi:hypothetical protein GCM10027268_05930 [Brachybacterium huguangmaarense]
MPEGPDGTARFTAMVDTALTVGILIGSNRTVRVGRQVAEQVASLVAEHDDVEALLLDLREIDLPWLDEPRPPSHGNYQLETTRAWARTVDALDAVVIVTSQYNGGYPAPLKNAIDTVYAEWRDKPILVVSYGSPRSGGGKASADALRTVFSVTRSHVIEPGTSIPLESSDYGEDLHLVDPADVVDRHREALEAQIGDLLAAAGDGRRGEG